MSRDSKKRKKGITSKIRNFIKEKVGNGGFKIQDIEKAQLTIESNEIDFTPGATRFVEKIEAVIEDIKSEKKEEEEAFNSIIGLIMQLKSQGSMFHYPLITDLSHIAVTFLEKTDILDKNGIEIIEAYIKSLRKILSKGMKSNVDETAGKEFCKELTKACNRYYKKIK